MSKVFIARIVVAFADLWKS